MRYIDVHTHLHDKVFAPDREDILSRMKDLSIGAITIGTDLETSDQAVDLANKHDNIWASVGQHPVDTKHIFDFELQSQWQSSRSWLAPFGRR